MDAPDSDLDMEDPHLRAAMGFPVIASLGPVGPLLRQLRSLTTVQNVVSEDEIQGLTEHLDGLCVSLMHHSELEAEEPLSSTAKCWMREVRELCYDTKNYLDDAPFVSKQDDDHGLTPQEKQENAQFEFKMLEARAKNASKRSQRYKIDHKSINKTTKLASTGRRLPVLHPELIDRGRMDNLASLLDDKEEKQLKVVSLVGLEGVGKTTLAKRIYHKTGGQFDCGAFVRVSPNPDMRRLLTSISKQIQLPRSSSSSSSSSGVSRPASCLDAQDLITNIEYYLRYKRYLIIIDDLWSTSVWDIIRRAFPDGGCHSRIITTTQFEDVASACCSYQSKYKFEMEPLQYDQSRKLFFGMVFGSEDKVSISEGFGEVSSEIIEKCGGLPLSMVNIASLLPTEESEINLQQWKDIRDSLPPTSRRNPTSQWMEKIINLIYNNLSPELKTCLLYLAVYPESYTSNKDDLVKQWVIEGFIGEGQNKEETAREYFDELVSRGMIQPVDINHRGVLSCTLHHMVHDLIVKKSMEGNFIIRVDYFQSAIWLPNKIRRLSVQFGGARSARIPVGIMMSEVRSLAFFGFYGCTDFIEECKLVRVLILHAWADQDKVPFDLSGISKLLPLRYVKIACNIAVKLPAEIQDLQFLETLEVDTPVVAIPSDIGGLSRLSSLKIAVRVLSRQDICILQELGALAALSVDVKETPTEWIVFGKGGFLVLEFFTFKCSAPRLLIEESAMPKIKKLNLCLNAHEAPPQDGKKPITIEHLASLKEISVKIWGAVADKGSALTNAVTNDARNPIPTVQLMKARTRGGAQLLHMQAHIGQSRMTSRMRDAIKEDAMLIPTEQHLDLRVDLTCASEDYAAFIKEFREKLADHPGKTSVHDRPILARQRYGKPAGLFMIKLAGYFSGTATLAIREDNLDLVGFKNQNGSWYEFGIADKSKPVLAESTFLGCEGGYVSLLGDRYLLHELKLGRIAAIDAISKLSSYQQRVDQLVVNQDTKLALARLMVMICEAARFAEIHKKVKEGWYKEIFITERQVEYIHNWENISHFLLGRRKTVSNIGFKDEAEAADVVHLVLNPPRPLVEVLALHADSSFRGTISVLQEDGGKVIIYKNPQGQRDDAPSQLQEIGFLGENINVKDFPPTATYRPVLADGEIRIQVDSIPTTSTHTRLSLLWDGHSDKAEYNTVKEHSITLDGSLAKLTYAVLRDAVEATVKVQLNLKEHQEAAGTVTAVYGEITATNRHYYDKTILLFRRPKEEAVKPEVNASDAAVSIPLKLMRDFVVASLESALVIKVSLRAVCSSYENRISFDQELLFNPNMGSEQTIKIDAPTMEAEVMFITSA